jgi:hypothetical protein
LGLFFLLRQSIINCIALNPSSLCGDETITTKDISPTSTNPTLCFIRTESIGNFSFASFSIFSIFFQPLARMYRRRFCLQKLPFLSHRSLLSL